MRGPSKLISLTDYLILTMSIFVSLTCAYLVVALEHPNGKRNALHRVLARPRFRAWFTALAVAFLLLFLDQFVRVLPKTPFSESVSGIAVLSFYVIVFVVAADVVRLVSATTSPADSAAPAAASVVALDAIDGHD